MVFRPESFKQLEKIIVQSFSGQTKVQLRSNCDNVIINIIIIYKINKYIKLVKIAKLTKIIQINIKNYISNTFLMS